MVFFLTPLVVAVVIVASVTAVLVRRDRRRMGTGPGTVLLESSAAAGPGDDSAGLGQRVCSHRSATAFTNRAGSFG